MKTALLLLVLFGLLAAAVVGSLRLWTGMGEVDMSVNGLLALGLGALVSLALGGGLMFLVFFSSRRGHDDRAGR